MIPLMGVRVMADFSKPRASGDDPEGKGEIEYGKV